MQDIIQQVYYIFALIGITNGLLLGLILLFRKKGNRISNRQLAILFLSVSGLLLPHLIMARYGIMANPVHIPFIYCVYLMALSNLGPSLYLYLQTLVNMPSKADPRSMFHYLLTLMVLISYFIFIRNHDPLWDPVHYVTLGQFFIYVALSTGLYFRLIRSQRNRNLPYTNSDILWVSVVFFTLIIELFIHFNVQVQIFTGYIHRLQAILLTTLLYFVMISELFYHRIEKLNDRNSKYAKSRMTDTETRLYLENIRKYMAEDNHFKNPSLTLPVVARDLKLSVHLISQVINEQLKQNFNDFLNSYRIEAAKNMLTDRAHDHLTIASIAYDCGFNSLSAFNNAFRKFSNMSPSQYRSKMLADVRVEMQ